MLKKVINLINGIKNSHNPFKYLISRLFVNYPNLFSRSYFKRKNYKLKKSSSALAAAMYVEGDDHLNFDEEFLKSLIRPNDCFIDVGANIGHISISLKKSIPNLRCYAVEANPNTFKVLNKNIILNNININSINCAVGDSDNATIKFQDSDSDDCNSVISENMIEKNNKKLYFVKNNKEITVNVKTLDYIANHFSILSNIRLIKIDTEGYELFVLKGSKNILKRTEMIYFEYWEKLTKKYNYTFKEIFSLLKNSGFDIYRVPNNLNIKNYDIKFFKLISEDISYHDNQNLLAINKFLL